MTIDDKIRDKKSFNMKQQKYQLDHLEKYLTGEEILLFNQRQITEQARFTYSGLRKPLEKQIKMIEKQGKKKKKLLKTKKKDQKLEPINLIIKVFIYKYLIKQLKKKLMK